MSSPEILPQDLDVLRRMLQDPTLTDRERIAISIAVKRINRQLAHGLDMATELIDAYRRGYDEACQVLREKMESEWPAQDIYDFLVGA